MTYLRILEIQFPLLHISEKYKYGHNYEGSTRIRSSSTAIDVKTHGDSEKHKNKEFWAVSAKLGSFLNGASLLRTQKSLFSEMKISQLRRQLSIFFSEILPECLKNHVDHEFVRKKLNFEHLVTFCRISVFGQMAIIGRQKE